MDDSYDVAIIGAGPAGLTAGIYSARYGLKTIVIGKNLGGMLNDTHKIENFPGFSGTGTELIKRISEQARECRAAILQNEIINIEKDEKQGKFVIRTAANKKVASKSLIIATGSEKKRLNVPGEEKFLGRGVSYCATCDAPFFKDKNVAVIGGRNSAAHTALLLAEHAKMVFVVYRQNSLNCDDILLKRINKNKKIDKEYNAVPVEIKGNEVVERLVIEKGNKKQEIVVDGVFVDIGSVPVTSLIKNFGIRLNENGFIIVDDSMATNVKGIFAAGDITSSQLKQVITAAAQGAIAANSAYKFLKDKTI